MGKHKIVGECEVVFTQKAAEIFAHSFVVLSPASVDRGIMAALKAFRREIPSISMVDGVSIEVREIADD